MSMRSLASYLLAGILVVLAMDFIAPPVGLGLAVVAWPAAVHSTTIQQSAPLQIVNRTHKGDRLSIPTMNVGKRQAPHSTPTVMIGCDPAFSPLSASARVNVSGRCLA